jgi:hypothetical protein
MVMAIAIARPVSLLQPKAMPADPYNSHAGNPSALLIDSTPDFGPRLLAVRIGVAYGIWETVGLPRGRTASAMIREASDATCLTSGKQVTEHHRQGAAL